MSADNNSGDAPAPLPVTDNDRAELAALIWASHAVALLAEIRAAKPSAAALNVTRAWLADNGVSMDSLRRIGDPSRGVKALLAQLPRFDDSEDGVSNAEPAVPAGEPFAPDSDAPSMTTEDTKGGTGP